MGNSRNSSDIVDILLGIWLAKALTVTVWALCKIIWGILLIIFAGGCFAFVYTLEGFSWLWKNAKGEN